MFQGLIYLIVQIAFFTNTGESETPKFKLSGQLYLKSEKLDKDVFRIAGYSDRSLLSSINSNSLFDIASLNKSFIANLILQGVAEGRWSRYSRLNDLLARYNFEARFSDSINLHQLLSHQSGIVDYNDLGESWKENNFKRFKTSHFSNEAYLDFIAALEHKESYKHFYYSNFAYHILAILLEAEYDCQFDNLLQEKIAKPLGMKSLYSPISREEIHPFLVEAYTFKEGAYHSNDYIDLSLGRRIFTKAQDLMIWLEAQGGAALLPDSLGRLLYQNQVASISKNNSYSYGWVPYEDSAHYEMGDLDIYPSYLIHGGSTGGFQSLAVSVNNGETNLVILSNNGDSKGLFAEAQRILKAIYHEN